MTFTTLLGRPSTSAIPYRPGGRPISHSAARNAPRAKISRSVARWVSSTRSPAAAKVTVCSPTMSPARSHRETDAAGRARLRGSVPLVDGEVRKRLAVRPGHGFAEGKRGAGGRVALHAMVRLAHFHIVALPERGRGQRHQPVEHRDSDAGVRRDQDGHPRRGRLEHRPGLEIEPRRAHQKRHIEIAAGARVLGDALRHAELHAPRRRRRAPRLDPRSPERPWADPRPPHRA